MVVGSSPTQVTLTNFCGFLWISVEFCDKKLFDSIVMRFDCIDCIDCNVKQKMN